MAQPTSFKIQYMGAVEVFPNKAYTAESFESEFPDSNIFILKTKTKTDVPISVSINKTPMFPISYDELTAFDSETDLSYVFNQKCVIAVAKELPTA